VGGRADFLQALTWELPALVIFYMLGVPESDVPRVKAWVSNRTRFSFGHMGPAPSAFMRTPRGLCSAVHLRVMEANAALAAYGALERRPMRPAMLLMLELRRLHIAVKQSHCKKIRQAVIPGSPVSAPQTRAVPSSLAVAVLWHWGRGGTAREPDRFRESQHERE
jgi:hypothetical protein